MCERELKNEIERNTKEKTKENLKKMINEGKMNSTNFWRIKSMIEKSKQPEPYDVVTEEGIRLQEEIETKEYVAKYFEELYQARPPKPEYMINTEKIQEK